MENNKEKEILIIGGVTGSGMSSTLKNAIVQSLQKQLAPVGSKPHEGEWWKKFYGKNKKSSRY